MRPEFKDSFPLIDSNELIQFTERFGLELPPSYSAFLLETNGGRPSPNAVRAQSYGETAVKFIYGLGEGESDTLARSIEMYRTRIPSSFITIGSDGLGNQILIGVEQPDRGRCFLWCHEEESDDNDAPGRDNIYLIADSFDDFLDGFFEPAEYSWGKLTDLFKRADINEVKALLKSGWDVNSKLEIGQTAIQRVVLTKPFNESLFEILVKAGADLAGTLDKAMLFNDTTLMKRLLKLGADPNEVGNTGNPLLTSAVMGGKTEAAVLLLRFGANPKIPNKVGKTAIEMAQLKISQGLESLAPVLKEMEGK